MMHHHECCYNLGGIFPFLRDMGGSTPQRCCRNLRGGGITLNVIDPGLPHEKSRRRRNLEGPPRHAGRTCSKC